MSAKPAVPAPAEPGLDPHARDAMGADLAVLTGGGRSGSVGPAPVERLETVTIVDGVPTAAAGPTAEHLAAALVADRVLDAGVRTEILYLLGQIAEAAMASLSGERGAPADAGRAHDDAVLACRALLPAILAAAEHLEDDDDADVRVEAADTAEAAQEALDAL